MIKRFTLCISAALISHAISAQSLTETQEADLTKIETMLRITRNLLEICVRD